MRSSANYQKHIVCSFFVCVIAGCAGETSFIDESNVVDDVVKTQALEDANVLEPAQASDTSSFSSLGYKAVDAGEYHTLAVRNDGRVFAAGSNLFGQLGNGTTTTLCANMT